MSRVYSYSIIVNWS